MRSDCIVMLTPDLDAHLRLVTTAKPVQAQALVAEATIEALVGAVPTRLPRVDQRGLDAGDLKPLEDCLADELGAVIRAQEGSASHSPISRYALR